MTRPKSGDMAIAERESERLRKRESERERGQKPLVILAVSFQVKHYSLS